jgi:hypothetical protein
MIFKILVVFLLIMILLDLDAIIRLLRASKEGAVKDE